MLILIKPMYVQYNLYPSKSATDLQVFTPMLTSQGNNEQSEPQNGSETEEINTMEEGDDVNVMLNRWLNEPLKDGPYIACCGEQYHLRNPSLQAVEGG